MDNKTYWPDDIKKMHEKYGVDTTVNTFDSEKLKKFLEFRLDFLNEELTEADAAFANNNADDVVDALIDLCVVAIGTLDAFNIDSYLAWNRVLEKNLQKEVGIKATRPNPLGLPDLIKPEGWTAPSHADNTGLLAKAFKKAN